MNPRRRSRFHRTAPPVDATPASAGERPVERRRTVARPGPEQAIAGFRQGLDPTQPRGRVAAQTSAVDRLTGLGDRQSFDLHLRREWALARRHQTESVVVIVGLDAVDDGSGLGVDDAAIREFADALRMAARGTDIVARIGGEEFAILLIECDEPGAEYFEHRLREALTEPSWTALARIELSLGHAPAGGATSAIEVLDRAEVMMLAHRHSRPLGSSPTRLVWPPERIDVPPELPVGGLAGLSDRLEFDQHVRRSWALARRHRTDSVVVVAGLHAAAASRTRRGADEILRQFAEAVRVAARSTDIAAHIGGREFAVLLIGCDDAGAEYFEGRLRSALTEPACPALAGVELSLGRAALRECPSAGDVLDRAEATMLARALRGGWASL
jgi:diguanylate cyclase (GGDEF)-like protein